LKQTILKNGKFHLFLISVIDTIFLFLLINNEKLLVPHIQKLFDLKTYQKIMQNHLLSYPLIVAFGILQPIIVIFLTATLSWIIAMSVFEEDEFSQIFYLSTKTYWVVVFSSGIRILVSFCSGKLFFLSLAFLTKNELLHTFLEVASLDTIVYIIVESFWIANLYKNKNHRRIFLVANPLFYIAVSFIIKAISVIL